MVAEATELLVRQIGKSVLRSRNKLLIAKQMTHCFFTHPDRVDNFFFLQSSRLTIVIAKPYLSQKLRSRNKQNVVSRYNEILLSIEKKEILTQAPTWMNLEGTLPSEISQSHDPAYVRHLEGPNS